MNRIPGVVVLFGVVLLVGCAGGGVPQGVGLLPSGPAQPPGASGPISLVGLWTVTEAGEEPGAVLRIAPRKQLSLWRSCGRLTGGWVGAQDVFLGELTGSSGTCFPAGGVPPDVTPSWLLRATGYRSQGADKVLVDRSETLVARLVPGGTPRVGADVAASEAEPPVITDEDRADLMRIADMPARLTRIEPTLVVGRWVPLTGAGEAFVEFHANGTWAGSDGCTGYRGRWTANSSSMLTTGGASALKACGSTPVPAWLADTAIAGLDNSVLVLLNATGVEVARLKPAR